MPAFGFSAVPSPKKIRRMPPGVNVADALGEATAAADGPAGSPEDTTATDAAERAAPPNSRRLPAAATHANGPNPGPSPEPPEPNHATKSAPTPETPPAAARAATRPTGAAVGTTDSTVESVDTSSGATDSEPAEESDDGTDGRSTEPEVTAMAPDTTELGRGCRTRELATAPPEESPPPVTADDPLPESATAPLRRPDPTEEPPARTGPRTADDFVDAAPADESAEPDPADPAEPVESANATGTDATAEPTPRATARAPTRPMCMAKPETADSDANTARRLYSIARTRPLTERR